ncbi:MAG TPA: hypothetical protein VKZ70_01535 [Burkholderiaceae bacterium]|nr:hypothetical protein [Burkholderiaceae bacterium]
MAAPFASHEEERLTVDRFLNAVAKFQRRRPATFDIKVGIGGTDLLVKVRSGRVESAESLAALRPLTPWDFALSAEASTWQRFWEATPAAGWHDIFALTRHGRMQIEGNLQPFMAHLQFVKDLLASPRTEVKP